MFKGRSEMHKRGAPHVCECCCMSIVALEIECSKHVDSFFFWCIAFVALKKKNTVPMWWDFSFALDSSSKECSNVKIG